MAKKTAAKSPNRIKFEKMLGGLKPAGGDRQLQLDANDANFILNEYSVNLKEGFSIHETKLWQIYQSRLMAKQYLPDETDQKNPSYDDAGGNNQDYPTNRSKYLYPITRAIMLKMLADMTAYPATFEYDTTTGETVVSDAVFEMEMFISNQFVSRRNVQQLSLALVHYIESGTLIAEPQYFQPEEGRYKEGPEGQMIKGEDVAPVALSFAVYDPLMCILDPSSSPGRVADTSRFAIITLGKWSVERIEAELKVKVDVNKAQRTLTMYSMYPQSSAMGQTADEYKRTLEDVAGSSGFSGIMVRKYLRVSDGMEYTVLDDGYVAKKEINRLGIYGRLWITVAPISIDPDSPYGIPIAEELRPSVDVISTIFNQICDINAANLNMPNISFKGLIDNADLTSGSYGRNDFIEADPSAFMAFEGFELDLNKLIRRIEIPGLDQDSMFVFNQAMQAIWYLTGLNPTTLSGYQDKQVRVAGVADMLQNSSMRNTSVVIKNFETMFLNPIAQEFHWILANKFKLFPDLAARGVTEQVLQKVGNIRVLNGSYLPADQVNKLQKAALIVNDAKTDMTIDAVRAKRFLYQQFGMNLRRFERDPLELLDEREVMSMLDLFEQGGPGKALEFLKQRAMQIKQAKGGAGGATQ